MQISDNGKGGLAEHGNGVTGIGERVRAIGGSLQIDSPPQRGTRLLISVPLRGRSEMPLSDALPMENHLAGSAA
jgi:two-component system sensor histidine kinase DesK